MTEFASMGKEELRAFCRASGISYSKLNNEGMRAALEEHIALTPPAEEFEATPEEDLRPVAQKTNEEWLAERHAYVELASKMDHTQMGHDGVDEHCPICGIHVSNGVAHYADIVDSAGEKEANTMVYEWVCLACNGEWGAKLNHTVAEKSAPSRSTGKGLPIEKNRETRNGIKRPSAGGKCRAIWDALDAMVSAGVTADSKAIKAWAEANGHNKNNASIEYYQWKKFVA